MPENVNSYLSRFKKLAIMVCITATVVSGFMGYLASMLYSLTLEGYVELVSIVGIVWGSICGLYAGIYWCRRMEKRIQTGEIAGLGKYGRSQGVKVGALATLWLHVGLVIIVGLASEFARPSGEWFAAIGGAFLMLLMGLAHGLIFGLPSGWILGAIFGSMCQGMVEEIAEEQTITEQDEEPQEP